MPCRHKGKSHQLFKSFFFYFTAWNDYLSTYSYLTGDNECEIYSNVLFNCINLAYDINQGSDYSITISKLTMMDERYLDKYMMVLMLNFNKNKNVNFISFSFFQFTVNRTLPCYCSNGIQHGYKFNICYSYELLDF